MIDDNEKLLINEVPEVLIGVSSTSSFNMQCLLFVTMNESKSLWQEFCNFFFFTWWFHRVSTLCWISKLPHTTRCLQEEKQYFSFEMKHNLHAALMNNTPSNSFSVDFIHFKYHFQFGIQAQNRVMFGLLFFICRIFCFQLIVRQHYNYDIWLPLFPVQQLYSNN